jgi:hypothetical protein
MELAHFLEATSPGQLRSIILAFQAIPDHEAGCPGRWWASEACFSFEVAKDQDGISVFRRGCN